MTTDKQDDLYDFARLLVDEGFGIWAVGANKTAMRSEGDHLNLTRDEVNDAALDLIDRGEATGVALRLGWDGRIESADGTFLVPFMLEREAPSKANAEFRQRMKDALFQAQASATFGKLPLRQAGRESFMISEGVGGYVDQSGVLDGADP